MAIRMLTGQRFYARVHKTILITRLSLSPTLSTNPRIRPPSPSSATSSPCPSDSLVNYGYLGPTDMPRDIRPRPDPLTPGSPPGLRDRSISVIDEQCMARFVPLQVTNVNISVPKTYAIPQDRSHPGSATHLLELPILHTYNSTPKSWKKMHLSNIVVLAFAALTAAEHGKARPAAEQGKARPDVYVASGATLYKQNNFRGASRRVETNGRCADLRGPLRDDVHSIRIGQFSDCYLY
ncbi:hypothetical protein L249_4674 [Ophiocordyceps polyrhachis-furcata BCC 54312]|uniref:Uncharacterized protein n=1 Tax=Ophiocordyceps polyrhachis-furcata BCC 54312 TaxID=1330021 RepID=A0A367L300_9HYPO|nr:hypothetical protein L249_4674 [Ophiocordyceps polyrhachis-furcata BCC 54312]